MLCLRRPLNHFIRCQLKNDIKSLFLGHFFQWEFKNNIEIIKNFGWKTSDRTEGTFTNFEDIDCGFMPMHQYFKFVKYGYGRATDHASYEIREGRMNKKKAKEFKQILVKLVRK